ncbi:MAG: PEP-CTERM sorting domain-containing protein [Burkholderiaceae bacterium]
MNLCKQIALAAAALLATVGAQAAVVASGTFGNVGLQSPGALSTTFNAPAGAASVEFQLDGFSSLDGDNFYIDVFTLSLNGTSVFSGTWDLGGGGADEVLLAPSGATATFTSRQTLDVVVPLSLLAGSNTLTFAYDSPLSWQGIDRAGPQGPGDEGWGVGAYTVTAAVPEPAPVALMLAGIGMVGGLARRRAKQLQAQG